MGLLQDFDEDEEISAALLGASRAGGVLALVSFFLGLDVGDMSLVDVGTRDATMTCDLLQAMLRPECAPSLSAAQCRKYVIALLAVGLDEGVSYAKEIDQIANQYFATSIRPLLEAPNGTSAEAVWLKTQYLDAVGLADNFDDQAEVVAHALLETGMLDAADLKQLVDRLCFSYGRAGCEEDDGLFRE